MNPATKLQLESFLITFVSTFLVALGSSFNNVSFGSLTWNVVIGLVVAAVGIAARAVYNAFVSSSIGTQLKTGSIVQTGAVK